jgi:hypothetical protein
LGQKGVECSFGFENKDVLGKLSFDLKAAKGKRKMSERKRKTCKSQSGAQAATQRKTEARKRTQHAQRSAAQKPNPTAESAADNLRM